MGDVPKPENETGGEWKMPEPEFRTSEGRTLGRVADSIADDPTEPGFSDPQIGNENDPLGVNAAPAPANDQSKVPTQGKVKKKSGCGRVVAWILALILLVVAIVVGLLIYFIYFYRPAETGNF